MEFSLVRSEVWAPHKDAAPNSRAEGDGFVSSANGTRFCCGGWQHVYSGLVPGHAYRISWRATWDGIREPTDMLVGHVYWAEMAPDCSVPGTAIIWDYVCAEPGGGPAVFSADLVAPAGTECMTIRATLRWTAEGRVVWSMPTIEDLGKPVVRPPVRVAVATGPQDAPAEGRRTVAGGTEYYARLAEAACSEGGARLVALPEIGIQWLVPGHAYEKAVPVPGPETDRFADIARRHGAVIVLGLLEKAGDAVHNSAVIIDAGGTVAGTYRKVHLASSEAMSGILPGDGFPVVDTAVGRVGCNICMDSSATESSRLVGLNGADFLVLPIMGDHRACRWTPGRPYLDEARWRCIHRTRAMDNQLCMVVARNRSAGSCIIDRSGEVLAYNDGNRDWIVADVRFDDRYRKWSGGCFRQVNWRQRRPRLYRAFTEPDPAALRRLRPRS
ncbi:MAG: carbon-nitrogen hydrolase family protein [Kiritimatiellaeota bacterium]|nr:carbon-nitrogen hydrolase family protein [Kiritimatiellota bacterium]